MLARFLSHFTWTFWLRASDDWSRARDRTTREAQGILNTAPERIGKICPFFMYICIILLYFQKQITVEIKLHAICLPRGPTFNDININKLVKSIDYLTAYWNAFLLGIVVQYFTNCGLWGYWNITTISESDEHIYTQGLGLQESIGLLGFTGWV